MHQTYNWWHARKNCKPNYNWFQEKRTIEHNAFYWVDQYTSTSKGPILMPGFLYRTVSRSLKVEVIRGEGQLGSMSLKVNVTEGFCHLRVEVTEGSRSLKVKVTASLSLMWSCPKELCVRIRFWTKVYTSVFFWHETHLKLVHPIQHM